MYCSLQAFNEDNTYRVEYDDGDVDERLNLSKEKWHIKGTTAAGKAMPKATPKASAAAAAGAGPSGSKAGAKGGAAATGGAAKGTPAGHGPWVPGGGAGGVVSNPQALVGQTVRVWVAARKDWVTGAITVSSAWALTVLSC